LLGSWHKAGLVGVLDAQDELAAAVAGDEIGVERGAQVAHVHVACGAGRETGDLCPLGKCPFYFFLVKALGSVTEK